MIIDNIDIIDPVVGIPNWKWKSYLVKYVKGNKYKITVLDIPLEFISYDCKRHIEIVKLFSKNNENYKDTDYYKYSIQNKRSIKATLRKISKFRKLYFSIKSHGIKTYPIITTNGCRIDGSHRVSILICLGYSDCPVYVVDIGKLCSKKKCYRIDKQVKKFRKSYYNF